jgi:predicted O-linked N-acetylglucosamine transferase (SPINDLY family)
MDQALQQAIASHHAGDLEEAGQAYLAILRAHPDHPEANHNMGVLAVQMKQPAAGLPYFVAALDADPVRGQYWLSYIDALFQTGQLEDARQVLALARQQGLQGDEVDALAKRLESGAPATVQPGTEPSHALKESPPASSIAPQNSLPSQKTKPAKSAGKHATHKGKAPSPQEINTLQALFNQGRLTEAEILAQNMTARYPEHEFGWKALGVVYQHMGRIADALAPMQKAAALSPKDAEAHNNLGIALQNLGRMDEAEASYRYALKIMPNYARAHSNLGSTLQELGRLDEAETSYRLALKYDPDYAKAHCNLGAVLKDLGRLDEAEASFRRALQIKPDYAEAHYNLGVTLKDMGRLDEAETSLQRALQIKPDYAEAHYNLGNTLCNLGRLDEAEVNLQRALQIKPDDVEALNCLSVVLHGLGRLGEADAILRRALQIKPDHAVIYSNLGVALLDMGRLREAEANLRLALEIKPNQAGALNNLGNILCAMGRMEEAEVIFRQVLQIEPDHVMAYSNLLFCLTHSTTMDAETLFAEHCRFGERFEAPLRASWPQHANIRNPERCLQVGFVSGDLHNHAVSSFIEPVLAHLSGYPQLSLHAYSNHAVEDASTRRIREHLTHWQSIVSLSDAALAEKIRADNIDVLIDLSGHTAKHRLLTFARKPAPVQATWIGYPGTTGLRAMDYYLADRFLLPEGEFDNQFTEKIVRLPVSAPFLPSEHAPPVNALPALSNGYVTFGSFNRPSKLSRHVIALWSQLLRALPDSRMLLGAMPQDNKYDNLIEWFAQEGIARERLSFHSRSGMDRYLALHHQVDVCLDTFPYNGGTTTWHALWMGVPTLTLSGNTLPGRVGVAILAHVGLGAFAAHDAADFVRKGLFWAGNLAELSDIRAGLRGRFAKSALNQPAVVAAGMERALRIMWRRWCAGLPAESFEAPLQDVNSKTPEVGK